MDSDASDSIMMQSCTNKFHLKLWNSNNEYHTVGGVTDSSKQTDKLTFSFPELNETRKIAKSFYILDMTSKRYDLIIGRNFMADIGLDVLASNQTITWDDAAIPWMNIDNTTKDACFYDGKAMKSQEKYLKSLNNILEAKYQRADLETIVAAMTYLSVKQKKKLLKLLKKMRLFLWNLRNMERN